MTVSVFTGGKENEAGFSIWSVVILLALIAFIAAAVMKAVSVPVALIGFVVVFAIIVLLAMLPDIIRYGKISSM